MRIIYPWAIGFCWENSFWVGFELFGCVFYHMQKVDICGPRRILASSYGALLAILVDVSNRVKSHTKIKEKEPRGRSWCPIKTPRKTRTQPNRADYLKQGPEALLKGPGTVCARCCGAFHPPPMRLISPLRGGLPASLAAIFRSQPHNHVPLRSFHPHKAPHRTRAGLCCQRRTG